MNIRHYIRMSANNDQMRIVDNKLTLLLNGIKTILRINLFDISELIQKAKSFDETERSKLMNLFKQGMRATHPDNCPADNNYRIEYYRYENAKELVLKHFDDAEIFSSLKANKDFMFNLKFLVSYRTKLKYLGKICSYETFDNCSTYNVKELNSEYEAKKQEDFLIAEKQNEERKRIESAQRKVQLHVKVISDDLFISGLYNGKTPYESPTPPICCLYKLDDYCGNEPLSETENKMFILFTCCKELVHKACYKSRLYNEITKNNSSDILLNINNLKYKLSCPNCGVSEFTSDLIDINTFMIDELTTNKRNQIWFNEVYFRSLNLIRNLETKTNHEKYELSKQKSELENNLDLSKKENQSLMNEVRNLQSRLDKMSTRANTTTDSSTIANTTTDSIDYSMDTSSDYQMVTTDPTYNHDEYSTNNYYQDQNNDITNNDMSDSKESSPIHNNHNDNNNNSSIMTNKSNICFRCSKEVKQKPDGSWIINSSVDLFSSESEKLQIQKILIASLSKSSSGGKEKSQCATVTEEEKHFLLQCPNLPCGRYIKVPKRDDGKFCHGGKSLKEFREHTCVGLGNYQKTKLKVKT